MKTFVPALFALFTGASLLAQPRAGDVVFSDRFDTPGALQRWATNSATIRLAAGHDSTSGLEVRADGHSSNAAVRIAIPLERIRGARVSCEAMVQAENVTRPPNSWNGIKVMLHLKSPSGDQWLQKNNVFGTFDWQRVRFNVSVPDDVTRAELVLGLESVQGVARFDDVLVKVLRGPRTRAAAAVASRGPIYKGHDSPRLRGAMIHPDLTADSLRVLGKEWNANVIRWQLIRTGQAARNVAVTNYDAWIDSELQKLDRALPLCAEYGVRVVLDLHSPPGGSSTAGGYVGSDTGLFTNKAAQTKFVETWQRIARKYQTNAVIWAYDLVNEPVDDDVGEGCDDWQALAERTAKAVRAIDTRHAIMIEPSPWGGPEAIKNLDPIAVPGVVYSVHVYVPHQFTHQGIHGNPAGISYPGVIKGRQWDKAAIARALQPVIDFQRQHNVHIFIGEFSAIRWAPDDSAFRYMRDCIELFEENGWDWTYHAFREWPGWSVEHGPDPTDNKSSKERTSREKLMREWFANNVKRTGTTHP